MVRAHHQCVAGGRSAHSADSNRTGLLLNDDVAEVRTTVVAGYSQAVIPDRVERVRGVHHVQLVARLGVRDREQGVSGVARLRGLQGLGAVPPAAILGRQAGVAKEEGHVEGLAGVVHRSSLFGNSIFGIERKRKSRCGLIACLVRLFN